jgi:hypothetical protein
MLWSDKIACHSGEPRFPDSTEDTWRPPEDTVDNAGYPRITQWRTCSYCGSIHPGDLFALTQRLKFLDHTTIESILSKDVASARAYPSMELADMKYGQPHKIYVNTREVLHPEKDFRYGTDRDGTLLMRKGYSPWIKFYITHLHDEGIDDEAFSMLTGELLRCTGVNLTRDEGGIKWQISRTRSNLS